MEHVSKKLRIVSLCTVLSRVLGLIRDAVLAATFGAGPVLDAFTLAFRIPNLARALLGEGAIATAFLPALVGEIEHNGRAAASRLISALFLALGAILCGLVLIAQVGLWALGWTQELGPEAELLRQLTALLLPYVILICLAAQVSAVLHASGEFLWPALIPVVLNLVWLVSLWWIVPRWSDPTAQVVAMSVCIVAAGVMQLAFPLPAMLRLGYRPAADWRLAAPQVRTIFAHAAPVLVGLSITQFNAFFDSAVAWTLARPEAAPDSIDWLGGVAYPLTAGTASALYFAQRLYQFPLGVFGVALGTVLYPLLSSHAQRGDWLQLRGDLSLGLRLVAAIGLPASAGLILLAEPIASACFEYGRFSTADTRQTARMIAIYGSAVWAYCGLLIVQRGFYALGDRLTPLYVGLGALGMNVILNLTLVWPLGGTGLAVATAAAAMMQCVVTGWLLDRRLGGIELAPLCATIGKSLAATLAMVAVGQSVLMLFAGSEGLSGRGLRIAAPMLASMAVYFAVAALLRLREPWDLIRLSRRGELRVEIATDE